LELRFREFLIDKENFMGPKGFTMGFATLNMVTAGLQDPKRKEKLKDNIVNAQRQSSPC
jgi:hypothetical protein